MRQTAWLGSTPDKAKKSRLEQIQGSSLGERDEEGNLIKAPAEVNLPEVLSPWVPMLGLFQLSGQASQTGYGLAALSWLELKAFREENDLDLTLWEREMLKKMSEAYCSEYHLASSPTRPAPYRPEVEEEEIDHIGRALHFREQLQLLKARKEQ